MNFFAQRMAFYNDMSSYSATLRRLVRLPRRGGKELAGFWTEHSERATVPTGLAIIGTPKEERDMLAMEARSLGLLHQVLCRGGETTPEEVRFDPPDGGEEHGAG